MDTHTGFVSDTILLSIGRALCGRANERIVRSTMLKLTDMLWCCKGDTALSLNMNRSCFAKKLFELFDTSSNVS